MKKLTSFGIAACAVVLSIALLIGCAVSESPATPAPGSPQTGEPEAAQPSGETLDDVLGLTAGIESVKFDMVMTSPQMASMTTKVWLKGQSMKSETTMDYQPIINIVNHETRTMYMYMPEQNTAFRVTYDDSQPSPIDTAQAIGQYQPLTTGTETIDGKVCLVVEYTVEDSSTKMWIWQEYGFPLKTVTETAQGTVTVEYKNIEFTDIPDSEFELPAGVQIMDMPSQFQG